MLSSPVSARPNVTVANSMNIHMVRRHGAVARSTTLARVVTSSITAVASSALICRSTAPITASGGVLVRTTTFVAARPT